MKKPIRLLSLLLVAVMLISVIPFSAMATTTALKNKTVIAFGDSLTALGNPTYVGYLSDLLGIDVVNAGVGGNMTSHAIARFETDVLSKNPDVVLLCFGMNDQACSLPSGISWISHSAYRANMSYIIEELQKINCDVVLITPNPVCDESGYYTPPADGTYTYNYPGSLDAFCKIIRELAIEYNCTLVDMNQEFKLLEKNDIETFKSYYGANDGIHQSQLGRQFWANEINAHLNAVYDNVSKATVTVNCVDENNKVIKSYNLYGAIGANIIVEPPVLPAFSTSAVANEVVFSNGKTVTFNYTFDATAVLEQAETLDYTQYTETTLAFIRREYAKAKNLLSAETVDFVALDKCVTNLEYYLSVKGAEPTVLSADKEYERTAPNYYKWDSATQAPSTELNETYSDDYIRLTDGKKGAVPASSNAYSAWQSDAEIVIDLGAETVSNVYRGYFASGQWGVATPADMKVSYSNDKSSWTYIDKAVVKTVMADGGSDDWSSTEYSVTSDENITARYIKFEITRTGSFVWVDEIEVASASETVEKGTAIAGKNGDLANGTQVYTTVPAGLANTDNVVAYWNSELSLYVISGVNVDDAVISGTDIIVASDSNSALANAKVGQYLKLYGVEEGIASYFSIRDNATDFVPDLPEEKVNLALNKTYEKSPLFRQSNITWDWDETFPEAYPDEGGKTLTDGNICTSNDLNDIAWVGFNAKTPAVAEVGYNYIRVDLGEVYGLTQLDLHVGSNGLGYGIVAPDAVEFFVSEDGETYTSVGSANGTNSGAASELLSVECEVNARYVEARITSASWAFVSEIFAYGGEAFADEEPTPDPDPDPVVKKGDLNGNDEIDAVDYSLLKRVYFGTYGVSDINVADINGNGEADAVDYTLLKRAYFGTYSVG